MESALSLALTPLEVSVLALLLAGDEPGLPELRSQLAASRVSRREHTAVGFFTDFEVPPSVPALGLRRRVVLGDVHGRLRAVDHGVGFLLFIDDGRLSMLEGFTYHEPWPAPEEVLELGYLKETAIGRTSHSLTPTESRDLVALRRCLVGIGSGGLRE